MGIIGRYRALLLLFPALALALAACAAPTTPAPAGSGQQGAPQASAQPKKGGTLVFGNAKLLNSAHPYHQNASVQQYINENTFESLLMYDLQGKLNGLLAEKWESNADGTQWTFSLRKGVKFHNGKEMNADDVLFSANYVMEPKNVAWGQGALAADIDRIDKVDPYTVRFHMKGPRGLFPTVVAQSQNLHIIPADSLAPGPTLTGPRPPGTGPFKFDEFIPSQQVVLSRFDGYWAGPAYLDKLIFKEVANEQARGNGLRSGDLHIAERIAVDLLLRIKKGEIKDLQADLAGYSGGRILIYNNKAKWLQQKKLREALTLAIDKNALMEEVFYGLATPMEVNIPQGSDWEKAANLQPRKRDVARAKQLVQESGYDGSPQVIIATKGQDTGLSEAVARMAKDAGINIQVKTVETAVLFDGVAKGDFDIAVFSQTSTLEPGLELGQYWRCEPGEVRRLNQAGYCNPQVDQLAEQYVKEPSRDKRLQIWAQMAKIVSDDFVYLYLGWTNSRAFGLRPEVKGFEHLGDGGYTHATGGLKRTWLDK